MTDEYIQKKLNEISDYIREGKSQRANINDTLSVINLTVNNMQLMIHGDPTKIDEKDKKVRDGLYRRIEALEKLVYSIPKDPVLTDKENAPRQKEFFKHIYNLLIGKDAGPRLSTFLWAVDKNRVVDLLAV